MPIHRHWVIHRADYQKVLADAAIAAGAEIKFSQRVAAIDSTTRTVTMQDGTTLQGDLIVGADGKYHSFPKARQVHSRKAPLGIRSVARTAISGVKETKSQLFSENSIRVILPRAVMLSSPLTAPFINENNMQLFVGPERNVVSYPIARGQLYNIVLGVTRSDAKEYNNTPGDVTTTQKLFSDFDESVRTMLSFAKECSLWTQNEAPYMPTWTSDDGGVVLVGDAAHAMPPHMAQGAAMGIEDAFMLRECLKRAQDRDDLPRLVNAFHELRRKRVDRVVSESKSNAKMFNLKEGDKEKEKRDQVYRESKEDGVVQSEAVADINKPWPHPNFLAWLHRYDGVKEAKEYFKD